MSIDHAVQPSRVLVTFGSRRGGTEELAESLARALRDHGLEVTCLRADDVRELAPFDAVVIGGALYMARWIREARRFIARHANALRSLPVWMFSSGPLDDTASRGELQPTASVARQMARIGARGHATFGGRLTREATGFLASRMAKTHAGDWRNWDSVARWGNEIASALGASGVRQAL